MKEIYCYKIWHIITNVSVLVYNCTMQHVSAAQISHRQVDVEYTKEYKWRESPQVSSSNVLVILRNFFFVEFESSSLKFYPWMSSGNYIYHNIYCYESQSLVPVDSQNNKKLLFRKSVSQLVSWKMCDVFSLKYYQNFDVLFSYNYIIIL